mmetsp:Transcript_4612/g.7372  ORF Transcript_4612/g.7372 Transcript_4612/m.7372 type:complete len:388 (-) Transcript_4612:253-1416(-)
MAILGSTHWCSPPPDKSNRPTHTLRPRANTRMLFIIHPRVEMYSINLFFFPAVEGVVTVQRRIHRLAYDPLDQIVHVRNIVDQTLTLTDELDSLLEIAVDGGLREGFRGGAELCDDVHFLPLGYKSRYHFVQRNIHFSSSYIYMPYYFDMMCVICHVYMSCNIYCVTHIRQSKNISKDASPQTLDRRYRRQHTKHTLTVKRTINNHRQRSGTTHQPHRLLALHHPRRYPVEILPVQRIALGTTTTATRNDFLRSSRQSRFFRDCESRTHGNPIRPQRYGARQSSSVRESARGDQRYFRKSRRYRRYEYRRRDVPAVRRGLVSRDHQGVGARLDGARRVLPIGDGRQYLSAVLAAGAFGDPISLSETDIYDRDAFFEGYFGIFGSSRH